MTRSTIGPPLQFLRKRAVQHLLDRAFAEPERYLSESAPDWMADPDFDELSNWYIGRFDTDLPSRDELKRALSESECITNSDASDSLAVYAMLNSLTPQQASDERLWVGLTHFDLYEYVRKRWKSVFRDGTTKDQKSRYVRGHWFVAGARGFYRDNGVSRLWWMGKILTNIARETDLAPVNVGHLLLRRADVRANLIERSSTASNIPVASEIVLSLEHFVETEKDERIYDRQVFRQWMIRINQLGGTLVLDAIPRKTLRHMVREEAKKAFATAT